MNIGPEEFVLTFGKADSPHDMVCYTILRCLFCCVLICWSGKTGRPQEHTQH
jgi:hypothetical protein